MLYYVFQYGFYIVVGTLFGLWALFCLLIFLWLLYGIVTQSLVFPLLKMFGLKTPGHFNKLTEQKKTIEHAAKSHWKSRKRPMTKRERSRKAWIIREHLQKQALHKPKGIDRDFFKKG